MEQKRISDLRILVFTVTSWNSVAGGSPWETLLCHYDRSNIANICIRNEVPDSEVCSRYFQISESKIIQSIFNRKIKTGSEYNHIVKNSINVEDHDKHNKLYNSQRDKRRYSLLLARELIWMIGKWKTKELDRFLDSFKPDIILHSMDGYIHFNRIIQYAIKRTGAKAIGYIWDDNFSYKQSKRIGYKMYRFFQRISLNKLRKQSASFFAILPKTKKEADEYFSIDCTLLTKPLNNLPEVNYHSVNIPLKMTYTGNLLIGRDDSLYKVCNALSRINKDKEYIHLDVYSQTENVCDILKAKGYSFCTVHGSVPQKEALEVQHRSDILLFLEDIDGEYAGSARLSFSTKITDYLSCGKCILAVGNRDTAPIEYFNKTESALIADSDDGIYENLKRLIDDTSELIRIAENARKCGISNHSKEKIQKTFEEVVEGVFCGK